MISGTPFLRKHKVIIDFVNNCLRLKDKIVRNQANEYKVGEGNFKIFLLGSQDLKVNLCGLQQDICSDGKK